MLHVVERRQSLHSLVPRQILGMRGMGEGKKISVFFLLPLSPCGRGGWGVRGQALR